MPFDARRMLRKMRGGSQAQLLEAADGHHYVVKFQNNPQHRRILINEWISAAFLSYLGLSCPAVAMVRITEEFLADTRMRTCNWEAALLPRSRLAFWLALPRRSRTHGGLRFLAGCAAGECAKPFGVPWRAGV